MDQLKNLSLSQLKDLLARRIAYERECSSGMKDTLRIVPGIKDLTERGLFSALLEPGFENVAEVRREILGIKRAIAEKAFKRRPARTTVSQAEIDLAKAVPISSLIDRTARRAGKYLVALCPFHNERTPSFTIYPDNRYHCFGCDEHGDSIKLIRRLHNMRFADAVRYLIKR